jgi:drug/metabolite transporter (DMT)-like permease
MRIALQTSFALPARFALFGLASVLLAMYGLFLNLAPVEFATVTGIQLASLFIMFQLVSYLFFRHILSSGVLLGGALIVAGSAIIYFWK